MIIKIEQPPNMEQIKKVLRVSPTACFAYGDIIYNPSGNPLDLPMLMHEAVHKVQQGNDPKGWWDRYLYDVDFRFGQELPAYQTQYKEAKRIIRNREHLNQYLVSIAKALSSELYGSIVTFGEAYKAIKEDKLYHFKFV